MSYAETELKVLRWGEARGIVANGKPVGQARKTAEESTELVEAMAKITLLKALAADMPKLVATDAFMGHWDKAMAEAKDAIGDVLVTLIMGAATIDVNVVDCLELAYDEIKDRKGYLGTDGVFIKEGK
jgi:NTP pyrophosphatase (non-canonical NTP hydrolase)